MSSGSFPAGGFGLRTFRLRSARDGVALTSRTRAVAEDLGMHARDVRDLSSATYETARLVMANPDVEAELGLSDGPSLQVVFRVTLADAADRIALRARLAESLAPFRAMVHELRVEDTDAGFSVCLRSLIPARAVDRIQRLPLFRAGADPATGAQDVAPAELPQRYADLDQACHELQVELQETNRGVIALHAELQAQADKLRQAEDRLRLLLDSVQDYAIFMLTPDGAVSSWNAGAGRLFGYRSEEVIGRHFECFYTDADRVAGVPGDHLRHAAKRNRVAGECVRVRREGAPFDAHVVLTAMRRGRERTLRGFSLVVRDITERKRLEHDLRSRADDLAAANRAKEDFLATLSHELRTPLNAMLGWTRLLRTGKLEGAAMGRALETIERNAHIQEQLIADILDVSRIVTGKLRLELRRMKLAPVVEAALDTVRPASEAKGVRLLSEIGYDGDVLGDPDRLQQVVWNLLANAIKFTPTGGTITVRVEQSGATAVTTVGDTGEGIPAALLPFIFDRFMQADASVTRSHGGLGLGLSIVRHIVELHGGNVEARSDGPGFGATFLVRLPVPVASATVEQPRSEQAGGQTEIQV
ncbi:MAG: sensor histidine kinase [Vicinamibacterales bacterium]